MRLAAASAAALAIVAGVVAPAAAHTVSRSPAVGDGSTTFRFKGTKWQPSGQVFAEYYPNARASRPSRTFRFRAGTSGRFVFRFSRAVQSSAQGLRQRLCFTQFDTRFNSRAAGFQGRRFRRCKRFYVEPPAARFWPSSGPPGTPFVLMTSGWYPGMRLTLELTRPDGLLETYTDWSPTRSRGAYIAVGPPFDTIFVRRGGAHRIFPGDPGVLIGTYDAVIFPSGSPGNDVRTAVTVTG